MAHYLQVTNRRYLRLHLIRVPLNRSLRTQSFFIPNVIPLHVPAAMQTSPHRKKCNLTYLQNTIAMPRGDLHLEGSKLNLSLDEFNWNKASVTNLKGSVASKENELQFNLDGILCEGKIETKGNISSMNQRPVSNASWKVKGIEMKQLLESFSNFDQTLLPQKI